MKSILLIIIPLFAHTLFAQVIISRDPEISKMVGEISPDSLRSYVNILVAFGTRNTLSTQTDAKRGIGAARNWVLKKFNEFSNQSTGRLAAVIDTTTIQPGGTRVDAPV